MLQACRAARFFWRKLQPRPRLAAWHKSANGFLGRARLADFEKSQLLRSRWQMKTPSGGPHRITSGFSYVFARFDEHPDGLRVEGDGVRRAGHPQKEAEAYGDRRGSLASASVWPAPKVQVVLVGWNGLIESRRSESMMSDGAPCSTYQIGGRHFRIPFRACTAPGRRCT